MVYPPLLTISIEEDGKKETRALKSRIRNFDPNSDLKSFTIFISAFTNEKLKSVSLAKSLHEEFKEDVKIFYISNNKIKVVCSKAIIANKIINNKKLQINYNVNVPLKNMEIKGRVPISTEYSEEDIFKQIKVYNESEQFVPKITEIHRITFEERIDNGNSKISISNNVIITFEGNQLPKYVTLDNLIIPVFIQVDAVRQCKKCWRFGHSQNSCRGKENCVNCGNLKHDDKEECITKCVNCGLKHKANDRLCPIYVAKKKTNIQKSKPTSNLNKLMNSNPFQMIASEFPPLIPVERNSNDTDRVLDESIEDNCAFMDTSENLNCNALVLSEDKIMKGSRKRTSNESNCGATKKITTSGNPAQLVHHVQSAYFDPNWLSQLVVHLQSFNQQDAVHILKQALDDKIVKYAYEDTMGSQGPSRS